MLSNKLVKIGSSKDTTSLTLKMGLKSWNWLCSELWGTWNIIKVMVQVSGAANRWEVPKQAWCKWATGVNKSGSVDRPIQKDPKSVFLQRPKPDWSQEYVRTFCVLLYRPNAFAMPNAQRVPGSMCIYWSQPHFYSSIFGIIGAFHMMRIGVSICIFVGSATAPTYPMFVGDAATPSNIVFVACFRGFRLAYRSTCSIPFSGGSIPLASHLFAKKDDQGLISIGRLPIDDWMSIFVMV